MTTLSQMPDARSLYLKAAGTVTRRSSGRPQVPPMEVSIDDVAIDPAHLERYAQVCGFELATDRLPITYPHVLAGNLHLYLMTRKPFPFPMLGLVHLRNDIRVHQSAVADARYRVDVRIGETRDVRQGLEFDLLTELNGDDGLVWSETSTILHRIAAPKGPRAARTPEPSGPLAEFRRFSVPVDTGRRYAAVSGDYNPIHLTSMSAKLFGFKRHIAHGMWSAARCAAELESALGHAPRALDVQFRQPLFLPGRVALKFHRSEARNEGGLDFSLLSGGSNKTHLTGHIL